MRKIDPISACALALRVLREGRELGHATGFIWQADKTYLITNWHVVTARNPVTLQSTDRSTAAEPDTLSVTTYRDSGQPVTRRLPLYEGDRPLWMVHSVHGRGVDVVALPVSRPGILKDLAINTWLLGNIETSVGSPLFVLGYPFAVERFPIWKLATVASEPALTPSVRPYLLVDTASRPGMSGSPVIRRQLERSATNATPSADEFVGVYSGRLHTHDQLDAQLGMVWPSDVVAELLRDGVRDIHPHAQRL